MSQERCLLALVPVGGCTGWWRWHQSSRTLLKCWSHSCHVYLSRSIVCSYWVLVDDDKNADGTMDTTLRTLISPALTGRLACLHCSSVMLTFVMILRVKRRLLSMSNSNVWPAQGDEYMTCMNFGTLHEAWRSTSALWAEMSRKRSNALFRSSSFFPRAESLKSN